MEKLKIFLLQKKGMIYVNAFLICALFMNNFLSVILIYISLFLWGANIYFTLEMQHDKKQKRLYKFLFVLPILFGTLYTLSLLSMLL